jgi:hypothetical protein
MIRIHTSDSINIINIPGSGNFFTRSTISPGFNVGEQLHNRLKSLNSGNAWGRVQLSLVHRISVIAGGAQVAGAEI